MNRTILIGRITKDIELKYTNSNIAVCKFTIAVNRTFGDKETDFINCIAWRKQAENMAQYVGKGSLIGIEGRIQTGSYEDKDGKRVYTTDVICDSVQFLESKNSNQQFASPQQEEVYNELHSDHPAIDVDESELPF